MKEIMVSFVLFLICLTNFFVIIYLRSEFNNLRDAFIILENRIRTIDLRLINFLVKKG